MAERFRIMKRWPSVPEAAQQANHVSYFSRERAERDMAEMEKLMPSRVFWIEEIRS